MRYVIVINPRAGRGAARRLRGEIAAGLRGHEFEFWEGEAGDGLRERCCTSAGADRPAVVAVGGDGTVNRVLNAIPGDGGLLGIVPAGTANDLATTLGIPREPARACRVLRAGRPRAIDLVEVNGVRFATCGGTDLAASVAHRAERWRCARGGWPARLLGRRRYALAAMRELAAGTPARTSFIETSGGRRVTHALAVLGSNQPRFGGRFCASPDAANDDGWLDICVIPRPRDAAGWVGLARWTWRGALWRIPGSARLRVREATVRTATPVRFLGDGEILAFGTSFSLRVLPRAATFLVPEVGGEA